MENINKNLLEENKARSQIITKLMFMIFVSYIISFILMLIFKIVFAYINEEDVVGSFMITFRSYALGSLNEGSNIFSTRFESIGVFAVHFTVFFGLMIYRMVFRELKLAPTTGSQSFAHTVAAVAFIIVGIFLTATMGRNFLFCLPEALAFSGVIYICRKHIVEIINKINPRIFSFIIAIVTIAALIFQMLPYVMD